MGFCSGFRLCQGARAGHCPARPPRMVRRYPPPTHYPPLSTPLPPLEHPELPTRTPTPQAPDRGRRSADPQRHRPKRARRLARAAGAGACTLLLATTQHTLPKPPPAHVRGCLCLLMYPRISADIHPQELVMVSASHHLHDHPRLALALRAAGRALSRRVARIGAWRAPLVPPRFAVSSSRSSPFPFRPRSPLLRRCAPRTRPLSTGKPPALPHGRRRQAAAVRQLHPYSCPCP